MDEELDNFEDDQPDFVHTKSGYKENWHAKKGDSSLLDIDQNFLDSASNSCYIDKNGIIIDANGVYMLVDTTGVTDFQTNEKFHMILPSDIIYHHKIGSGNGGVVRKAIHKSTGIPLAVKIINVYDKEKRH